jgi:hypothetical protein
MYAKTTLMVVSALLASAAFAGNEGQTTTGQTTLPSFTTLDANGDGSVSQDEAQASAALSAQWSALDANQDGELSSTEYANATGMSESDSDSTSDESEY